MPEAEEVAHLFVEPLQEVFECYHIDTIPRQAAFLAQVGHESVRFTVLTETLNYSVKGLLRVYPTLFTPEQAQEYAHKPKRIASRVYAGRSGNRDEASSDGWTYRGRGLFPIRGATMYRGVGFALTGDPAYFLRDPYRLSAPTWSTRSAGWVWDGLSGNELADEDTEFAFRKLTRRVNKGVHGFPDRLDLWKRGKELLRLIPVGPPKAQVRP
jgi:putative chitinase